MKNDTKNFLLVTYLIGVVIAGVIYFSLSPIGIVPALMSWWAIGCGMALLRLLIRLIAGKKPIPDSTWDIDG